MAAHLHPCYCDHWHLCLQTKALCLGLHLSLSPTSLHRRLSHHPVEYFNLFIRVNLKKSFIGLWDKYCCLLCLGKFRIWLNCYVIRGINVIKIKLGVLQDTKCNIYHRHSHTSFPSSLLRFFPFWVPFADPGSSVLLFFACGFSTSPSIKTWNTHILRWYQKRPKRSL